MKFNLFGKFFWNASIDRKHYWLFRLFKNYVCVSFMNDEPIRAMDLWLNAEK
jgi:hypothetical protein